MSTSSIGVDLQFSPPSVCVVLTVTPVVSFSLTAIKLAMREHRLRIAFDPESSWKNVVLARYYLLHRPEHLCHKHLITRTGSSATITTSHTAVVFSTEVDIHISGSVSVTDTLRNQERLYIDKYDEDVVYSESDLAKVLTLTIYSG